MQQLSNDIDSSSLRQCTDFLAEIFVHWREAHLGKVILVLNCSLFNYLSEDRFVGDLQGGRDISDDSLV
jgi:hypothetical protein